MLADGAEYKGSDLESSAGWQLWLERLRAVEAPPQWQLVSFLVASAMAAGIVASVEFVPIVDHINLAFHEFGHPLFGILGELMGWLGGTLFQFVFPIATTVHFLRQQHWLSAAACLTWLFENFRYVAFYVADARTQALPLVGGGQHDWGYLLGRWGLLEYDTRIAGVLTFISWSGWALVWSFVALWWWQGRQVAEDAAREQRRRELIESAREREKQRQAQRGG